MAGPADREMEDLRSRLRDRMEELRRRSRSLELQQRAEPSRTAEPRDPGDLAAGLQRDDARGRVDDVVREEIQQIEDALDRMDRGRYGICEDCGRPIPVSRLRVEPQATRCLDCAEGGES